LTLAIGGFSSDVFSFTRKINNKIEFVSKLKLANGLIGKIRPFVI